MGRRLGVAFVLALLPLLAGGVVVGQEATPPGAPGWSLVPALSYELVGPGLRVTVESPAIPAVPPTLHVTYHFYPPAGSGRSADVPQVFAYDGPRENVGAFPQDGRRGWALTVTVEARPDFRTVPLTLLLPDVNLSGAAELPIDALAILVTHANSIGGPGLVEGPLQTYEVVRLHGTVNQTGP